MRTTKVYFDNCEIEVSKVSMKQGHKVRKMKKEKMKFNT